MILGFPKNFSIQILHTPIDAGCAAVGTSCPEPDRVVSSPRTRHGEEVEVCRSVPVHHGHDHVGACDGKRNTDSESGAEPGAVLTRYHLASKYHHWDLVRCRLVHSTGERGIAVAVVQRQYRSSRKVPARFDLEFTTVGVVGAHGPPLYA